MSRLKQVLGAAVFGCTVLASAYAAVPAAAVPAGDVVPATCSARAHPVNGNLDGTGTRQGCNDRVRFEVYVKKDVFGFDPEAGSKIRDDFRNGDLTADGDCRHGHGNYYTEVRVNGEKMDQSERGEHC